MFQSKTFVPSFTNQHFFHHGKLQHTKLPLTSFRKFCVLASILEKRFVVDNDIFIYYVSVTIFISLIKAPYHSFVLKCASIIFHLKTKLFFELLKVQVPFAIT